MIILFEIIYGANKHILLNCGKYLWGMVKCGVESKSMCFWNSNRLILVKVVDLRLRFGLLWISGVSLIEYSEALETIKKN